MLLRENEYYIFIAHNAKGYDAYMIINELQKRKNPRDADIFATVNGSKVMFFKFRKISIKDSSLFIPARLDQFSKIFNLKELKKGFFPHEFNTPSNEKYKGPIPHKMYFGYEYMNTEKQEEFNKFYLNFVKNGNFFDFEKEFHEYCWSDFQLLTEGCLSFTKLIKEDTKLSPEDDGISPLEEKTTLASFCNLLYTRNFMPADSLGLLPSYGYNPKGNISKDCELWLKYLCFSQKLNINHAKNGGEFKICISKNEFFFADGFDQQTNTIYEFLGCFFHGCSKCFLPNTFNPVVQLLNSTLYERTLKRNQRILEKFPHFKIICMWSHEWEELKKTDSSLQQFLKSQRLAPPLNPRHALFGGRTNGLKLYHKCEPDEEIRYNDITSLYPFIMKYGEFPIGNPIIITENIDINKKYFGLILCEVLPLQDLYIPILPFRVGDKLLFPLCRTCSENFLSECYHSDDERVLFGTWCSKELYEAVEHGYKIIYIYEVFHFEKTAKFDPSKGLPGLFENYINSALKRKQEASGFPENCKTDFDKDLYVENYFKCEGIKLEKDKIEKNSGRRQISKLILNTLWGYFALNTNKKSFKVITEPLEWHSLLLNDRYIIHSVELSNENFIQVQYSEKEEFHFGGLSTNVILAAFVTCQARLKLFSELKLLNRRVLYFDTDSIIYVTQKVRNPFYGPENYEIKLGPYLGDFTNEIDPKDGNYILEFVCCGPKNYGYKTDKNKTECTVKGITFTNVVSLKLNFDTMTKLAKTADTNEISVPQFRFSRNINDWTVKTGVFEKKYKFVYDKRIIKEDLTTLPYGFKE